MEFNSDKFNDLINPVYLFRCLYAHRNLIIALTRREISSQYQGLSFGFIWAIILVDPKNQTDKRAKDR